MPQQQLSTKTYTNNGWSCTFTLHGQATLWTKGLFKQEMNKLLQESMDKFSQALLSEAQEGYNFEPMRSSFEVIGKPKRAAQSLAVGGIQTADPIFPFVEWDTAPHWPPPRRQGVISFTLMKNGKFRRKYGGVPGTGIEGWVARHSSPRINPATGREYPTANTVWDVRAIIASRGTAGRHVVTNAIPTLSDTFVETVANGVDGILDK